jgi:hypothetical protein
VSSGAGRAGALLRVAPLALLLAVAGCAKAPGAPPLTSLAGRPCAAQPDLAAARPLLLASGKDVTVELPAGGDCLEAGGVEPSAYAAFKLPDAVEPYLLTVTSKPAGQALFTPRLLLLDAAGATTREVARETFVFHGASLYTGLRVRPGERFLVVASDPRSIGQSVDQITASTSATTMSTGVAIFTVHSGAEATQRYTYAHNGTVTVAAEPMPKVK